MVEASNGNRYRLTLGADRSWLATYIPDPVTVRLGSTGGIVSLTPNEDGNMATGLCLVFQRRQGHGQQWI